MNGAAPSVTKPAVGPRPATRRELAWAAVLGLAAFVALAATESRVGFVRDEGYYFRAADDYGRWYALLVTRPSQALTRQAVDAAFAYNSEHPVLAKSLFGISHEILVNKLHVVRDAAGYRAPAWAMTSVLVAFLYLLAAALVSHRAAVFAVAAYLLTPRQLFNGSLACFDAPEAALWVATAYAYWRSAGSSRWAVASGVLFGLTISIKHNGYFLPPLLALHYALGRAPAAKREGGWKAVARGALPFGAMAVIGPLVFLAHWPWLWFDTVARFSAYVAFHTGHLNYPWAYLGKLLVDPPFPVAYPFVVTALTVPVAFVALMVTGLAAECGTLARTLWRRAPIDADGLFVVVNGLWPLTIIAFPTVPHFGGVKHWLAGMPFLFLIAGAALERCAETTRVVAPHLGRGAFPLLALLACAPALVGSMRIHPYGTSFYNELAGGSPGAAMLGMQRQFWSNNVTGVLPWLNENAPPGSRVWFHEVNGESYEAYRRNSMLRPDIQYAWGAGDSQIVAHQYMQEFRDQEFQVWSAYGTNRPAAGLYLDEVPNVVVYRRP